MDDHRRDLLLRLARAGIDSVTGERVVAEALTGRTRPCAVVALGKAAGAMAAGAASALGSGIARGFIAHPTGYHWNTQPTGSAWTVHTGGHPLPDEASIAAGHALHDWLLQLPDGLPLVVLMSGGASACIESPVEGVDLEMLRARIAGWMAEGLDIHALNAHRGALSRLKCGRARAACGTREVEVLVMSDVPGDDPAVVGGGPFVGPRREGCTRKSDATRRDSVQIIATNADALRTIVEHATQLGVTVNAVQALDGDALERGTAIGHMLCDAAPGLHAWGGETTVRLPAAPGRGGRCQAFALAAALAFANRSDCVLLALASDGIDGNGPDAGALVDGGTVLRIQAEGIDTGDALARADAGTALAAAGDLVQTGPTGSNVMDLVLGYVSA